MLFIFVFIFLSMVLPVVAMTLIDAKLLDKAFVAVPVGVALQVGFFGTFAIFLYRLSDYGWLKYGTLLPLSTAGVYYILRWVSQTELIRTRRPQSAKLLGLIAVLAFVSILDNAFILQRNGWSFEDGSLMGPRATYFRAPLNNDMERNVVVINALLRKSAPPFLTELPSCIRFSGIT